MYRNNRVIRKWTLFLACVRVFDETHSSVYPTSVYVSFKITLCIKIQNDVSHIIVATHDGEKKIVVCSTLGFLFLFFLVLFFAYSADGIRNVFYLHAILLGRWLNAGSYYRRRATLQDRLGTADELLARRTKIYNKKKKCQQFFFVSILFNIVFAARSTLSLCVCVRVSAGRSRYSLLH